MAELTVKELNLVLMRFYDSIKNANLTDREKDQVLTDFTSFLIPGIVRSMDRENFRLCDGGRLPESQRDLKAALRAAKDSLSDVAGSGYLSHNTDRSGHATRELISRAFKQAEIDLSRTGPG